MTRRHWIADIVSGDHAAITGSHAEHLSRVLRARVGQQFHISTGAGVREGTVVSVGKSRVEFELGDEVDITKTPPVTLGLAIFKFDRMEWAIEKCTELGVAEIIPVIARRTETHLATAAAGRVERWRRIAHQAAEQSRRNGLPQISVPVRLKELVGANGTRIVLSELEKEITLKDAVSNAAEKTILVVGPEGGWTEAELKLFQDAGWQSATLGGNILRAETAAIAALAIVSSEMK